MKRNPVSFTVEHDSPKTMRTDLMDCLKDLTTLIRDRSDCP